MKISVIGASAGIGLATVQRGLERGHFVTTLSRSQLTLPANPHLKTIQGNATHEQDLQQALQDTQAVIVTLGTGKSLKATTLFTDFANTLLSLHAKTPLSMPIIVLTGFGAGESHAYLGNCVITSLFDLFLGSIYANKTKMEALISASNLKWMMVRPGVLTNQKPTERYRVEDKLFKGMKIRTISRFDVADFLIKQAENPTFLYQYPALSST
jgi:putative NADH-flavin reductase